MAASSASSRATGNASATALVASSASSLIASAPRAQPLVLLKGMSFPDGKAAIYFVQDYALHTNKQVRVGCRGGKHRKMVCSSEGCPFFVQVYQRHSKADKTWYLSSFDASHAPDCTSSAKPTKRQLVAMASFKDAIVQTPEASAASLASYIEDQSRVPLRMNLRTVYRAKETLRSALVDKQAQSFRRVTSLLHQFAALNPGSYAKHDVDESGRFLRAFVACGVVTQAMPQHQQIFGFECVPAVGMFPGFHMYLLGKDSNRKTVIVAAAVVASLRGVTEDHLLWFFRSAHAAGISVQLTPIIAIVTSQLLAVEAELGLTFRICTRYLIEKELAKIPTFNEHHQTLVWGLQASETAQEYNNRLHWIATACGQEVAALLRQVSYERWVLAGSMDQRPLYGWRSRDFSEGRGGDASEAIGPFIQQQQHKLPFDFLDALMEKWAQDVFDRSSSSEKWAQAGLKVTPGAQELYDQEVKHIGEFVVTRSSPSVAFVSQVTSNAGSTSAPTATRCRVDLASNTCTCTFMQQHGIPCRHLIAVVLFCGQMDSITARFASIYHTASVGAAYHNKGVELPLQASLAETDDCLPPGMVVKVPRGPKPKPRPALLPASDTTNDGHAHEPSDQQTETTEDATPQSTDASATRKTSKKRSQPEPEGTTDAEAANTTNATNDTAPIAKPKRCSRCKSTGHNVRSCPVAASAAASAAPSGASLLP